MRNNERHLRCEQYTYEDAMSICRKVLDTDAINIEFNCGAVDVYDIEKDQTHDFASIVNRGGIDGFTNRCVAICPTGYQYGFEDKWDILVIEED